VPDLLIGLNSKRFCSISNITAASSLLLLQPSMWEGLKGVSESFAAESLLGRSRTVAVKHQ